MLTHGMSCLNIIEQEVHHLVEECKKPRTSVKNAVDIQYIIDLKTSCLLQIGMPNVSVLVKP